MRDSGHRFGLRRGLKPGDGPQRPPWTNEVRVRDACTSCGDCITACPEGILKAGPANTPVLDFNLGECTFCKSCATACNEDVFLDLEQAPWAQVAEIGAGCLLKSGIGCQVCTDGCPERALFFDLSVRPVGAIHVRAEACSGCGACVSVCPSGAIAMKVPAPQPEPEHAHG